MVKADSVDYYAALEVSPDATVDEIKKQYRKLALKSHPDRNPGHEAESSARFQAIGAAHEVLTDPEQRRKYDLSRKLPNGSAQRTSAPRNPNPFGPGMQEFDPPPRRGDPRYTASSRSSAPPPPPRPGAGPHPANAGAARYKYFNPPPSSQPPTSSMQDAKANAGRLHEAWRASRGGPAPAPTRKKYNVPPPPSGFGRPGAATPEDMGRPPPPSDRYPASFQQQQQQQQRQPPSRQGTGRSGFDPASPDADESAAQSAAYRPFGRANPPRMNASDFPGAPNLPPRASAQRRPSYGNSSRRPSTTEDSIPQNDAHNHPSRSRSGDQIPYSEGNRERMPYTNHIKGEKTYFDSDALRRTASMRDAARMASQAAHEERHRSASQNRSPSYKPYTEYSSDNESNTSSSPRTQSRRGSKDGPGLDDSKHPQSMPQSFPAQQTPHEGPLDASPQDRTNGQHSSAEAMDIDDPLPGAKADSNINLNDLRNVHPFVPESSNPMDMNDLKDTLPFQSKPSPTHPLKQNDTADASSSHTANPLDYLNPPKPPVAPQNFGADTWAGYLQRMTHYFTAWNTFNAKVIAHFQDRAVQNQDRERGLDMVDGWLGAVGETETLGGWDTYVRSVDEDERVRMRWNVACERHLEAVERHTRARKRAMESGVLK